MDGEQLSARDFGTAFKNFLEGASSGLPAQEPDLAPRIREHLGAEPTGLPVVTRQFEITDRPNVQVALDAVTGADGRRVEMVGISSAYLSFEGTSISRLVTRHRAGMYGDVAPASGPVKYASFDLGGSTLTCIDTALLFITTEDGPLVVLIWTGSDRTVHQGKIEVQVMAPGREDGVRFLDELRAEMRARNVYRGRVISLERLQGGASRVHFHDLPEVDREQIILPPGVLERVEAHSIAFAKHADRLRAAGRHLRRGLLLYGPPGTGKTMTTTYIANSLPGRTVILLTGSGLGMIEQSVTMARLLEPSLVVLEDVDLVAEDRTRQDVRQNVVLFELLNQMDGLTEDTDIVFLLTTNRPDLLEPALAARPGRIDQAIEIPLPDPSCRRRLFDLYSTGLELDVVDFDRVVERTRGVSPAFIRELLRKAALFAAEDSNNGLVVRDKNLDEALHDLVIEGGELTKTLLGGAPTPIS